MREFIVISCNKVFFLPHYFFSFNFSHRARKKNMRCRLFCLLLMHCLSLFIIFHTFSPQFLLRVHFVDHADSVAISEP